MPLYSKAYAKKVYSWIFPGQPVQSVATLNIRTCSCSRGPNDIDSQVSAQFTLWHHYADFLCQLSGSWIWFGEGVVWKLKSNCNCWVEKIRRVWCYGGDCLQLKKSWLDILRIDQQSVVRWLMQRVNYWRLFLAWLDLKSTNVLMDVLCFFRKISWPAFPFPTSTCSQHHCPYTCSRHALLTVPILDGHGCLSGINCHSSQGRYSASIWLPEELELHVEFLIALKSIVPKDEDFDTRCHLSSSEGELLQGSNKVPIISWGSTWKRNGLWTEFQLQIITNIISTAFTLLSRPPQK